MQSLLWSFIYAVFKVPLNCRTVKTKSYQWWGAFMVSKSIHSSVTSALILSAYLVLTWRNLGEEIKYNIKASDLQILRIHSYSFLESILLCVLYICKIWKSNVILFPSSRSCMISHQGQKRIMMLSCQSKLWDIMLSPVIKV